MNDKHARTPMRPRETSEQFWSEVWKIALGIFLGSVISALFGGLLLIVAGAFLQWRFTAAAAPPSKPAIANIDDINEDILDYKALTRTDASEAEKAIAAGGVVKAFRQRRPQERGRMGRQGEASPVSTGGGKEDGAGEVAAQTSLRARHNRPYRRHKPLHQQTIATRLKQLI